MKRTEVITAILEGVCDDDLDSVMAAYSLRRKKLARRLFNELRIGDKVRITGNIKPRYMQGHEGIVFDKRESKVEVQFGAPIGRFGSRVIVPGTCLTKVEDD